MEVILILPLDACADALAQAEAKASKLLLGGEKKWKVVLAGKLETEHSASRALPELSLGVQHHLFASLAPEAILSAVRQSNSRWPVVWIGSDFVTADAIRLADSIQRFDFVIGRPRSPSPQNWLGRVLTRWSTLPREPQHAASAASLAWAAVGDFVNQVPAELSSAHWLQWAMREGFRCGEFEVPKTDLILSSLNTTAASLSSRAA